MTYSPLPTCCKKGHVRTPENTYFDPKTGRPSCKDCRHNVNREFKTTAKARIWKLKRMLEGQERRVSETKSEIERLEGGVE